MAHNVAVPLRASDRPWMESCVTTFPMGLCLCGRRGSACRPAPSLFRIKLTERDPVGKPVGQGYSGSTPCAQVRERRGPSAGWTAPGLPPNPSPLLPRPPIWSTDHIVLEMISLLHKSSLLTQVASWLKEGITPSCNNDD